MRTWVDVRCDRCGCTTSGMWIGCEDLVGSHACPDDGRPGTPTTTTHSVPGPGERRRDGER